MVDTTLVDSFSNKWEANKEIFNQWIEDEKYNLGPGLNPEPTIKVLVFLALLDAQKDCTYAEIRAIFKTKNVIKGNLPDITLRTSTLSLGKTLDKFNHPLELKSFRGKFQLIKRESKNSDTSSSKQSYPVVLILEPPAFNAEDIACELVEKSRLPFHSLYFLEWSARWWGIFSHNESQIRVQYECGAWEKLGIKDRLLKKTNEYFSFISLAPGEGLAEIELLKKILSENPKMTVHYLAIDTSQRLLREHINLLKEALATEISNNRIICVGIIADIFSGISDTLNKVRLELVNSFLIKNIEDFIPASSSLFVTYLGNCLGNCYQDQETEIFSIIYSAFSNRPIEFLVGVSVMRKIPDEYKRNWDDFLLQTPKHLLETNKLLESSRPSNCDSLQEFDLPDHGISNRCPSVVPENYTVRHGIDGQVYRFYYKLEYNLMLAQTLNKGLKHLPSGSLILLYNIVKYNINTLVSGIKKCGLFEIAYDEKYHQIVDTPNGKREYAVFSAYLK